MCRYSSDWTRKLTTMGNKAQHCLTRITELLFLSFSLPASALDEFGAGHLTTCNRSISTRTGQSLNSWMSAPFSNVYADTSKSHQLVLGWNCNRSFYSVTKSTAAQHTQRNETNVISHFSPSSIHQWWIDDNCKSARPSRIWKYTLPNVFSSDKSEPDCSSVYYCCIKYLFSKPIICQHSCCYDLG